MPVCRTPSGLTGLQPLRNVLRLGRVRRQVARRGVGYTPRSSEGQQQLVENDSRPILRRRCLLRSYLGANVARIGQSAAAERAFIQLRDRIVCPFSGIPKRCSRLVLLLASHVLDEILE